MHRILLLFAILPLFAALILRKLNADRALSVARKTHLHLKPEALARRMLDSMGLQDVELKTKKRVWAGASILGDGWFCLPPPKADEPEHEMSAHAHGQAALRVGLYLLSQRDPAAISRRQWALRFGQVMPIFTTIVVVFGLAVAKIPVFWGLSIIVASLGLATCAQVFTVVAGRQAASMACLILEKKRTLPRLSEEEAVVASTRAWAWYGIVPGLLSRLM